MCGASAAGGHGALGVFLGARQGSIAEEGQVRAGGQAQGRQQQQAGRQAGREGGTEAVRPAYRGASAPLRPPPSLQDRLQQTRAPEALRRFILKGEIPQEARRKAGLLPR